MIDLAEMKGITIDPARATATAEGGVTWGELNDAAAAHGLAVTGGAVSSTGIAGLTLGGGLGWLMAKHGLAADNLLGVELVRQMARCSMSTPTRIRISSGRSAAAAGTSASRRRSLPPAPAADDRRRADRPSLRRRAGLAPLLPRRCQPEPRTT